MERANKNELSQLYYHITNRCNLACRHCWVKAAAPGQNKEMTLDDVKGIIGQAKVLGLRHVKVTGGEPFVVDWILEFLQYLRANNITLGIESNGTLISSSIAQQLAEYDGNLAVAISIDGATAASHESLRGVSGCFAAALEGIHNLVAAQVRPSVLVAVYQGNKHELEDIGRLVASHGVREAKINCVTPGGRGDEMRRNGELLDEQAKLELYESLGNLERQTGISWQMSIPLSLVSLTSVRHRRHCGACNITNTLGLLPNGDFALCGIALTLHELVFGNYRTDDLGRIWNEHPLLQELAAGLPDRLEGVCGECLLKWSCRGDCRAIAYASSRRLLGSYPMCQWARDHGRFPPSRLAPA